MFIKGMNRLRAAYLDIDPTVNLTPEWTRFRTGRTNGPIS